jgi:DNA repair protein RecN (Recombination protein N)
MLTELSIRDLALIDEAVLELGEGFNAVTGETGAGKTLIVGALELLLGLRPRSQIVRAGAAMALVEGRFELRSGRAAEAIRGWLARHAPALHDDLGDETADGTLELVLGRSVSADGKSQAHVDHRPVPLKLLRELAALLCEIHGQNDHQKLLERGEQLGLVDRFGGLESSRDAYRRSRSAWLELDDRLALRSQEASGRRDRIDSLRFQLGELRAAAVRAGERAELLAERERLRHAEALRAELGGLLEELCNADDAALGRLQRAERVLAAWKERIPELAGPADCASEAACQLADAGRDLLSFLETVEIDPARLEALEQRIGELDRLARKYATDEQGLAALSEELAGELERLLEQESGSGELEREHALARQALERAGRELSAARAAARPKLLRGVKKALADLGLERAEFDLAWIATEGPDERSRFGENGCEAVEMRLAANPGEGLRPLREVASGGEMARIMLALRSALAAAEGSVLVFDEIDAGVGGHLAAKVAEHLRRLSRKHQVLVVTHLPAIAAAADRHLKVEKQVQRGRTRTRVAALEGEERVSEVADMIAGGSSFQSARAEAKRLLESMSP